MSSTWAPPPDVWGLIDEEPHVADDGPELGGWLQRLCRATSRALPASAVALTIGAPGAESVRVASSGDRAGVIEQLQFTLGEGPCHDAFSLGRPVLVPDLSVEGTTRWPGYVPALRQHGIRAVFAFPLRIGALRLGTLDVYRDHAGPLTAEAMAYAVAFTAAAVTSLLDVNAGPGESADGAPLRDDVLSGNIELYQAQGMVGVQLGVTLDEAMVRMRAYAFVHDRPVDDVARDIVARRLVLETDS